MRIAFLCKRKYMGKDVIDDRYARLYEIPFQLAQLGHDVRGYCLGYQRQSAADVDHPAEPGRLHWRGRPIGSPGYPWQVLKDLRAFQPELLIGASDIPHAALTAWLARRLRLPYAIDLYDHFESFGQARIPGMKSMLRHAVRAADVVTTTSEPLQALVESDYRARGQVIAMPSTVDLSIFKPREKAIARQALGLPADAVLIGTAGGLYPDKGVDLIYSAWPALAARYPHLQLVLAGPYRETAAPPTGPRVHYLGQLPHMRTAELFAALDLGVVYMRNTLFGRYCFPQKAYEMIASGLPLISADVGAMTHVLRDRPEALYRADDTADFIRAVEAALASPVPSQVPVDDWATLIGRLEPALIAAVKHHSTGR
ncbi:MAG TPA: glycosyltransferase family 4 protein [Dyella sp.]|uniref:glycosyltransferase family 4 protein n=1 Tax=Dyella sp. TaxID=1869338 RepID=UPI002F94957C